ncbi:hypothetical protein A3Q56_05631 [Intoshia linei]|uniref:Valine--tRNA ligase, mitochondrial n=1 Tax=Intoshia linei TaxID=1819745 RepID=A0A177AYQ6_9BILA|nr:hypothetical protein A3Q56_05631 [Intoshia linei]
MKERNLIKLSETTAQMDTENLSKSQLRKKEKKEFKLQKYNAKMNKKSAEPKKVKDSQVKFDDIIYKKNTIKGEKKDTSEFPSKYSPIYVEKCWLDWWIEKGFFEPQGNGEPFTIIIPPPNITGNLHLGHALTTAIEDSLVRWNRMLGKRVLYNPGCDHAGIATQIVVEKIIKNTENKSRHDIGRENFIEKVYEWKDEKMDSIYSQLKMLGGSYDWTRPVFSMDAKCVNAVKKAFIDFHEEGLIFRKFRLVNWSCSLKSAISNIEVDKLEISGPTYVKVPGYNSVKFGTIIYFAYKLFDSDDEIIVATTRIETMLADKAIAVNPKDERYLKYHGKFVVHPFNGEKLPIIPDNFVDIDFGTGAVKITPAHDPNDYECGIRNNLEILVLITDDGYINEVGGQFSGLKRFDARLKVLNALKEKKLFRSEKDHSMTLNICSRSKDIIEPLPKAQWYLNCKEMSENAINVVKNGELEIIPSTFKKTWFSWLDNCQDWCISRQLWWGHRIPVYFVEINNQVSDEFDSRYWVSAYNEEKALEKATKRFNVEKSCINLHQDQDVLDTWFSAALFPISFFGWPNHLDYKKFYPTSLLETGHDILFFWVARMVMVCTKITSQIPFKQIYLHAMIRDAHGRKMSKSLGNVIDPRDVITGASLEKLNDTLDNGLLDEKEINKAKAGQKKDFPNGIPQCGSDAMRFSLCIYTSQSRDINLNVLRIRSVRFFCNKVWNATRFCLECFDQVLEPFELDSFDITSILTDDVNNWILHQLYETVNKCNNCFSSFNLSEVATTLLSFWITKFCDIFVEYVKLYCKKTNEKKHPSNQEHLKVLYFCIHTSLLLLHPLMPFLTEELYQRIAIYNLDRSESITIAKYPTTLQFIKYKNLTVENEVDMLMQTVKEIRSLRAEFSYDTCCDIILEASPIYLNCFKKFTRVIKLFGNAKDVILTGMDDEKINTTCIDWAFSKDVTIKICCNNDKFNVNVQRQKIVDKKESICINLTDLKKKKFDQNFTSHAPDHVINLNNEKIDDLECQLKRLNLIKF